MNNDSDYEVGYGRPPAASRFQKGQSGNPAGRRRGSKNLSNLVRQALDERLTITVNGRKRSVSKLEAALLQQANEAAKGNGKAIQLLTGLLVGAETREAVQGRGETAPSERRRRDQQVLDALKARFGNYGALEEDCGED